MVGVLELAWEGQDASQPRPGEEAASVVLAEFAGLVMWTASECCRAERDR